MVDEWCDSNHVPYVLHALGSYIEKNSKENVMEQLRMRVSLPIEIKLKGEPGTKHKTHNLMIEVVKVKFDQ